MSKTYDNSTINVFPEGFKMVLPAGYRIDTEFNDEGEQVATLRGGFYTNDDGEEACSFSASFVTMNSEIKNREEIIKQGRLKEHFVPGLMLEEVAKPVMENLQEQIGTGTRLNLYNSFPASTVMKFYKPFSIFGVTLESYIVLYLVEVTENIMFGFNTVYQNSDEGNDDFFKHLLTVIKSVRVNDNAVDIGKLTARKLEMALDMDPDEDVEALDLGVSLGINIQNGDEETRYTINSDGSITEETVELPSIEEIDDEDDDPEDYGPDEDGPIDTLRVSDSYDAQFLQEHGKDIRRMIAGGYGYVNYLTLSACPNVEEFIVERNSGFSFVDGVLYSKSGDKRTIEYVTKNVKHLHIDADVKSVSSYWHGVEKVTVDPANSAFSAQGDMLLSRRKNNLYFVTSGAEEVIIPEGVTRIHARAFEFCGKLKKVVFPASYDWNGWYASNFEPILITHENMKNAGIIINGDKAKYENGMIVSAMGIRPEPILYLGDKSLCHIPADMTSTFRFGQAFAYVENFEVSKDNPLLSSADGVILDKSGTKLEFYPRARKDFAIPASVTEIESQSVANCNELSDIVIPGHVEKIGQMAFANCACLKDVKVLNPNADVHKEAYFGCHLLNGDSFAPEPVDEEELKKSVAKEIRAIRKANKRSDGADTDSGYGMFGFGSAFAGNAAKDVRFSDNDSRKVIVDNKWSFTLPEGLELRFDSEHVDIMGDNTTANYVVEGLEYNGRYFFDFELRERYEDGMSTDVDLIGCRHDSSVISGSAQQKIIKDDDDLYVDFIRKPVFFSSLMVSIRVRGEGLRSWDFTAGVKSMDQDMEARWDEVKGLMNELAESISLLDAAKKSAKKSTKKKAETASDPDFIISKGVLRKYIGQKNDIVIPDGVKEIADSTFSGYSKIKSVVIPEGVKKIGRRCFENCIRLKNCYLPESLEELGGYAFVDCHELKEVYLGEKLKVLGDSAFSECFVLKDVKIPKKVKEIEAFTFKNCDAFTHIVIPEGVKSIGFSAFAGCDKLEYLYVPKSVTEIAIDFMGNHPFAGSDKLTIYTPEGSYAQKFADEHGIPYKNAAKGKVTADNTKARSDSAEAQSKSNKSITGNDGLAYATPDESLYPHFDSKHKPQGLGFLGITVVSNPSGTDYKFYQLAEDLAEDSSEELKNAVSRLSDTGAANYKLAERADEMRGVFHVAPDVFDFRHDKECEIAQGMMQSAYMMSGLRSFAWTLSKYCDDLKTVPGKLTLEQIRKIIDFASDRDWLNYDGNSYCKSLCGTSDVHVFYLPDNTPKSVRKAFEPSEKELEDARKMKEQFPSYSPIHSQVGSLDGLRKDLEYIYPAIETIYEDIKANRDFNEPLTGNDGDILYAWCSLAYAARGPFFSEDGPMTCWFTREETEEERQQREAEELRRTIEERAEISKKYMASYGKYFEKNPKIQFRDKKFVFSGVKARAYQLKDDTDYNKLIEDKGGLTRSGVSGVTDYLVIDPAGAGESKISKAIENQGKGKPTKIILLDDLRKALGLPADENAAAAEKPAAKASAAPAAKKTSAPASAAASAPAASAPKKASTGKAKTTGPAASGEKTVTVDNAWVIAVPDGFKYSTDKAEIGDHRNIIIMEDKDENSFAWPFDASISFTSALNETPDGPGMAKIMTGFMSEDNLEVLRDEDDIYVAHWYAKNRSDADLKIYQINVGCSDGVSSIQVFFSESGLSRREQSKLVEKVAKSIRLANEVSSYSTASSSAASSALSAEQQRQVDELNSQLEDLRSQAALYSDQSLSAEDRATLAEANAGIDKLGEQLSSIESDQKKFGEFLRQKEEREKKEEEERQRRIAEALAAGKNEDDEVNMFVILCNEEKDKTWEKNQSELYEAYKDYFPAYKTRELGKLRKEVKEKIKDKETRRYYTESFMKRSVKNRFDVVTDAYFSLDRYADYSLRSEDAIIKTAEWYTADEMPEVRKLMKELLDINRKSVDDAFGPVEPKWKKFWTAKEFLKVVVKDKSGEEIRKDTRLFHALAANNYLSGPLEVEVILATKGLLQLSTSVLNFLPYYWGISADQIWGAARNNEIADESTAYIEDINVTVQNAIKSINDKNPDVKSTLSLWESSALGHARTFTDYISQLYDRTDKHYTLATIKSNLKASYKTAADFAEGREKLYEFAQNNNLVYLASILEERLPVWDIYDSIPKRLSEDIKEARKEKLLAENTKKYEEAKNLAKSDSLKDLIKAEEIFQSLGNYSDSKDLLKKCTERSASVKAAQYDEAVDLAKSGEEKSITLAIDKMNELGSFRDAQVKAKEYRKTLENNRKLAEIKTLSQSSSIDDLSRAITLLEDFRSEGKSADALIKHCTDKIESIRNEKYEEAISLAAEGTIPSLTSALSKLKSIAPYKDSTEKIIEFNKTIEKERQYVDASSRIVSSNPSALKDARRKLESLGDYKESAHLAIQCTEKINSIVDENREKAQKLIDAGDAPSMISAEKLLIYLKDIDEDTDNHRTYDDKIAKIGEIHLAENEILRLKDEHAKLGGAFKKKERKAVEQRIAEEETKIESLRSALTSAGNNEVQIDVETISEEDSEPAVIETTVETVTETADIPVQSSVQQKPAKKSKKGLVILIILMLLAVAAAVLYLTGVLYISPDADECLIEEYLPSGGTEEATALSIEKSRDAVDTSDDLVIVYKITNKSNDDIWDLYGDIAFLDKKGKELDTAGFGYRGLLKPGKSVYLYASSYEVKPKKIALVKLLSYNYSVGQTYYLVNVTTGTVEKGASDYEYNSNVNYEMANCLNFEINNRGLDDYNSYNVDVTTNNGGSTPVKQVGFQIDFLDKDGNIIDSRSGYFENELGPSSSLMSEAKSYEKIEGDGSTKLIDSAVINRYEYYRTSEDSYGNNYFSVDLVNGIAYGAHYD